MPSDSDSRDGEGTVCVMSFVFLYRLFISGLSSFACMFSDPVCEKSFETMHGASAFSILFIQAPLDPTPTGNDEKNEAV